MASPAPQDNFGQNAQQFINAVIAAAQNAARETPGPDPSNNNGVKSRQPDTFDGKDRSKLTPFLAQCRMVFLSKPRQYAEDKTKIIYAASYLTDIAAAWFEPYLSKDDDPIRLEWKEFESELRKMFGDPDEKKTAERKLSELRMANHHQVATYITNFRKHQALVEWGDEALKFQFRKGLPDRILDDLARREDAPKTLTDLQDVALKLDLRYWERQDEKKNSEARTSHTPRNSETVTKKVYTEQRTPKFNKGTPQKYPPKETYVQRTEQRTVQPAPRYTPFKKPAGPVPDLGKKLTEDGHLKDSELKRRVENNLCKYCGKPGHRVAECRLAARKNSDSTAKAAVTTEEASAPKAENS